MNIADTRNQAMDLVQETLKRSAEALSMAFSGSAEQMSDQLDALSQGSNKHLRAATVENAQGGTANLQPNGQGPQVVFQPETILVHE